MQDEHLDRMATALEALAFSVETHMERIADALDDILIEIRKEDT